MKLYELWPKLKDGDGIISDNNEMMIKENNHLISTSGIKMYVFTPEFAFEYEWEIVEPF